MIQNAALGRSQVFARSRVSVTCWRGDSKACVQAEMHKMGTKTMRHHPTTGLYSYGCINIFCWHKPMFVVDKIIEPSTPSASASHISRLRTPLETDWSKSFLLRRCLLSCRGNDCLALHLEPTSPLSSLLSNKNTSTWRDSKQFHWLEGTGILPFSKDKSK